MVIFMNPLRVFYVRVNLSWGFNIRFKGTSASQPTYPLPTPTTVVGAFAYSLARLLGLNPYTSDVYKWGDGRLISSTMKIFLEATLTASAGLVASDSSTTGLAAYSELGRIIATPYKGATELARIRKPLYSDDFFTDSIPRALPVQALGSVYAPNTYLELSWVVDIEKLSRELRVSIDKLDSIAEKAAYGITRIGSKEGIVAVEPTYVKYIKNPMELRPGDKFRTRLYVEEVCAEVLDPSYVFEITLPDIRYRDRLYYLPARAASKVFIMPLREELKPPLFRVLSPCKAITIPEEDFALGVIS